MPVLYGETSPPVAQEAETMPRKRKAKTSKAASEATPDADNSDSSDS